MICWSYNFLCLNSDLEVWISLVYEMNSMQSPTTTAIGRSVLSQSHRNSGMQT